ncbi:MAG TPA: ATP-binding protein [Nitrolancea sp.]|jgi:two-component system sensor histidine kinase UhpB|nr:ATP-binding protein [Nitrolancea sp.]
MQYVAPREEPAGWYDRVRGLPLFYKVLIANSTIVVVGAVFGTALTLRAARETGAIYSLVAIFAVIGTLTSIAVNWFVLRAALRPLLVLEKTVDEVRRGDFRVRVKKVGIGDPHIDVLTDTFNGMLDAVERYRTQIHEMSVRALNAQEDERKRISRELHDDTAQALTAQLLRLKTIEATGGTLDPNGLSQLIELTAETLEDVRHMAHELRPPSLDDLGLLASLEGLVAQCRERFDLPVVFYSDGLKSRPAPDVELTVYRIVQEAVTNIAKHAGECEATVSLRVYRNTLWVRITDNGLGFDTSTLSYEDGSGLGLFGMQERAALVNGTVTISSGRGRGTEIEVRVPLGSVLQSPAVEGVHP